MLHLSLYGVAIDIVATAIIVPSLAAKSSTGTGAMSVSRRVGVDAIIVVPSPRPGVGSVAIGFGWCTIPSSLL